MKAMPQYQDMLNKYSMHINLQTAAMDTFNSIDNKNLVKIVSLEQDMAVGEDSDGRPVKNLISSMPPFLTDNQVELFDKLRLLMIYIISQEGIKDTDRKRLMELAKLNNNDQSAISNLRYLGVTLLKGSKIKNKQKIKEKSKKKQRDDAPPFELSRYVPLLKQIIEDASSNTLSNTDFPFIKEPSSAPSTNKKEEVSLRKGSQPRWANKGKERKSEISNSGGDRIIIFIAGGITYSEMRCVYEISQKLNREVILGNKIYFILLLFLLIKFRIKFNNYTKTIH
jgi:syntaxin-binding protein 1